MCAGLFLLALSYHLGARSARAQSSSNPIVSASGGLVVTANGDLYCSSDACNGAPCVRVNNVFASAAVGAQRHSLGQLKQLYR